MTISFRQIKILLVLIVTATGFSSFASAQQVVSSEAARFKVETIVSGLKFPWGLAFLPDGALLITERSGALRLFQDGKLSKPVSGLPKIAVRGQGGLLDVALDPDFKSTSKIFITFVQSGRGGIGTAVASGRLMRKGNPRLENVKVIFTMERKSRGGRHFGSRIAFAADKTLYFTIGDRGEMDRAQDPKDHAGSLLRINRDGSIPANNPFADGKKGLPEIWAIGLRNIQGATIHPETGLLWTVEHGARGGDEINRPEAGKNYGWPVISYGVHYSGAKIGVGTSAPGMEQPIYYWDPSIAPSGLAFYTGNLFKKWKGNLFVGALKDQMLVRLVMKGNKIVREERLLQGRYGRIRDVRSGPDGALWLLTDDGEGRVLRLTPA